MESSNPKYPFSMATDVRLVALQTKSLEMPTEVVALVEVCEEVCSAAAQQ